MNKLLLSFAIIGSTYLLIAPSAHAAGGASGTGTITHCQEVYGGGKNCQTTNIVLNKMVANPTTGQYVENLSINDPKYTPGQSVKFQITVKNTGNQDATSVVLQDMFPSFIDLDTSVGSFDKNTKTVTINIPTLKPGETNTFVVIGKIKGLTDLPQQEGITCMVNTARATIAGQTAQDTASFCVQKPGTTKGGLQVLATPVVTKTPATGPEAILFGLVPMGILGQFLRKKSA